MTISSIRIALTGTLVSILLSMVLVSTSHAVEFNNSEDFDFSNPTSGQELGCLAMNIYFEGRGEPAKGRAAIAAVTMNRVSSGQFPDTVCEVVWQRKQFSWTHVAPRHHVITDIDAWQQALVIAELFISGAQISLVGDANHYHSVNVSPSWQDETKLVAEVGDHYFYAL